MPLIPLSEPSYAAEQGRLLKDDALLERIIPLFDPLWERDMIADTYIELCLLLKKKPPGKERRLRLWAAAERLYALNQGALRQNGITLPVELLLAAADGGDTTAGDDAAGGNNTAGATSPRRTERTLRKTLKKMGIEAVRPEKRGGENRYRLSITVSGGEALCELYDRGRGTSFFREFIPLPSLDSAALSAFAATLGDAVFIGFNQ